MRVRSNSRRETGEVNLTPMIDVVFLLIIFFMLSSHFARQDSQVHLALPQADTGHDQPLDDTPRVVINLLRDGRFFLSGEELKAEQLKLRLIKNTNANKQDLQVRIRADRLVPYRHVEPLLLACAEAGVWDVSFAVVQDNSMLPGRRN